MALHSWLGRASLLVTDASWKHFGTDLHVVCWDLRALQATGHAGALKDPPLAPFLTFLLLSTKAVKIWQLQ